MGVGAGLYIYDVVVKNSRSLYHLLMRFLCLKLQRPCTTLSITVLLRTSTTSSLSAPTILSSTSTAVTNNQTHRCLSDKNSLTAFSVCVVVQMSETVFIKTYRLTCHIPESTQDIFSALLLALNLYLDDCQSPNSQFLQD